MRLLLDEHVSPTIAEQLRRRGCDAVAVAERADLRSMPDAHIWSVAGIEGRAVVTANIADFLRLAAGAERHPGLVLLPGRTALRAGAAGPLVAALDALARSEAGAGSVIWLGTGRL